MLVRPGTDTALALGLARLAYERGHVDRERVERECVGGEAFERHVMAGHDAAWTADTTGVDESTLAELIERSLDAYERERAAEGV